MPSGITAQVFNVKSQEGKQIAKFVTAFREISAATVGALELDRELNFILEEVTEKYKFEFATVALVDEYRRLIETVRGKNVPLGWRDIFKCPLDADYILADIVRFKKMEVIRGWDSRLNRDVFQRFGFAQSVRVFVPLFSENKVIGVIWAGCSLDSEKAILTPDTLKALENLGASRGPKVASCRPYILLEVIANNAIDIIEADSASIHIVQQGQPLLEATAGRAKLEFLHKHPPSSDGIGAKAMSTGEPQWIDDPEALRITHSGLYNEGIRAFAAFPLACGADVRGVLYVHFWHIQKITPIDIELESAFARQMEVAIKNSLLMRDVAEYAEKAWMTSGLQKIINSVASRSTLKEIMEEIANHSLYMLGADSLTLYTYFQAEKRLAFPPVMAGTFREQQLINSQETGEVVWNILLEGEPVYFDDAATQQVLNGPRKDIRSRARFVDREGIKSMAAIPLKAGSAKETVGIIFVNYRQHRRFSDADKRLINALGATAAIALHSVRLQDQIRMDLGRRNKEIEALREIDRKISIATVTEVNGIWELILNKAVDILGAATGSVWRVNGARKKVELAVYWPKNDATRMAVLPFGSELVPIVVDKGTNASSELGAAHYQLAVPLIDNDNVIGAIVVDYRQEALNDRDQGLLETFSVLAITALHIVDEYRQLTEQIQSFRSLCLIQLCIQDANNDLETLLQMLATGVTSQQGLGFSRAMIFLTDDSENLIGVTAIGALSKEEATSTWQRLKDFSEKMFSDGKSEKDVLTQLLIESEKHVSAVKNGEEQEWPLCKVIKGILIPTARQKGAIRDCLSIGKAQVVEDGHYDSFRGIFQEILGGGAGMCAFVSVPLIGKKRKNLGVLVADNRFLLCEREIDKAKLHSLEAFAGVAAMSIENVKLRDAYRNEAERADQKAKLFNEVLVETAHEFRSPLQNIFGQIPVLRRHLDSQPEVAAIISGIEDEIFRAKKVMANSLSFGAGMKYNFSENSFRPIFEACVLEYENRGAERNIRIIIWDSAKRLPKIDMDSERIRQVVTNLLDNAVKYSFNGENINIRGRASDNYVEFLVQDKGLGIPQVHNKRIFSEFVRHVVADPKRFIPGTGVGLKVVDDIVQAHKGQIAVTSAPFLDDPNRQTPEDGHTVTFTVALPKFRNEQ